MRGFLLQVFGLTSSLADDFSYQEYQIDGVLSVVELSARFVSTRFSNWFCSFLVDISIPP